VYISETPVETFHRVMIEEDEEEEEEEEEGKPVPDVKEPALPDLPVKGEENLCRMIL
jgi:hypothetical protein